MRSGAVPSPLGSRWRLALAAILAVTAVVIGLFTMHSMVGTASHSGAGNAPVTQAAESHIHPETSALQSAAVADPHRESSVLAVACDQACQMSCLMVGLICALGLLAILVTILLPRIGSALTSIKNVGQRMIRAAVAVVASPRPPSLTALSISRT